MRLRADSVKDGPRLQHSAGAARKILGCRMPVSPNQVEDNSFDLRGAVKQFQALKSAPFDPCTLSPAS
ncbi:hypothetical protein RD149_25055 [Gordonia westfalica]|uniref:Peptidoglycan binding domain-containing protein n=1 Tax=Gordonia westfalica TaxID=158898 RepID=A0ABU2GZW3_9ACTN|nr:MULTISPECIES: hypothetical protein [Gordonia]MDS1117003.1 hypothetical protein [Gordonia westfalica]TSD92842.1 hypothetical protein FOV72_21810 [Gordonia rubripertincta]